MGGGLFKGLFGGGGDDEKELALQREQGRVAEIAAARAAAARTAFAAAAQSDAQRAELYRQLAEIVRSTGMSGLSSRAQADVAKARLQAAQAQSMAARVRAQAAYSNVNRDRGSTPDPGSKPSAEDWLRSQILGSDPKEEGAEAPRTDGKPKGE